MLFAGHLVSHVKKGPEILHLVRAFPLVTLAASIQPITRTVLKVLLTITPDFEWQDRLHGSTSEPWWVWVEDADNNLMYHSEYFLLQKKQVRTYIMLLHLCNYCIFCLLKFWDYSIPLVMPTLSRYVLIM